MKNVLQRGLSATLVVGLLIGMVTYVPAKLDFKDLTLSDPVETMTDPEPWASKVKPMTDPEPWANNSTTMTDPEPWAGTVKPMTDPEPWA